MTRSYFIVLAILLFLFGLVLYLSRQQAAVPVGPQGQLLEKNQGKLPARQSRATPEGESGFREVTEVSAQRMMVATANGHASRAGMEILKAGGNAVDAAIAAQMVLNVVEPQSSGIGGGAFLLHWDAAAKKLSSHDGREVAPALADEKLFLRPDGSALGFGEAVRSGRSIGVPGVVAMLAQLHDAHGKLPWAQLFEPAIRLARAGFPLSPRLHKMLGDKGKDFFNSAGQALFFDESGAALPVGTVLKYPELAASFELIADKGAAGFYQGELAAAIVAAGQAAPGEPSRISLDDLQAYRAIERPAVCGLYLTYKVCGMGLPSSGGMTTLMILNMIAPLPLGSEVTAEALHLIAEAEKLAFADRGRYMADPDFVAPPMGLLDAQYLDGRRQLIDASQAMEEAAPGTPPEASKTQLGRDGTVEIGGTSHLSIIDGAGNIISMTSSIEGAFGSGQMVKGFLLNNQLTDFSFKPADEEGRVIANRVAPNKRPRSSMAPTLVFDAAGAPRVIVGSPGGSRIIGYVVKALVAHLNWGMGPQEAVALFNFGSRNGPFELEVRPESAAFAAPLEALGQVVKPSVMTSGLQMIVIDEAGLRGGADPRREGVVLGE